MTNEVRVALCEDIFAGDGEIEALMRRLQALHDLASQISKAKTELEACSIASDILSAYPEDIPFALLYLLDLTQTKQAQLLGTAGCEAGISFSPLSVNTTAPGIWPFDTVLETGQAAVVPNLSDRIPCVPPGPWSEPPHTALVLPITQLGQAQPAGFLVAGISSRHVLDDEYRTFLGLVAGQISTAVANARAYEEERTRADTLTELDQSNTALFGNVSDELRTPLTPMLSSAENALVEIEEPLSPRQREQIEAVVRQRDELRLLTNAIPALICYVDHDRRFRFANRAYTDWFGHSAEAIIGQTVAEFVGETTYEYMRPHVEAALAGEPVTVEMWIPFQDVGPRYVRRQYIPDIDNRGEVKGFYALINDMTTLKQAEAERERLLQELEIERARFEAVLQQLPAGVMIADAASGKVVLTNEQAKQIIGYSYEQSLPIEEYERIVLFEGFRSDGQRYTPDEYPLVRSLRTGEVVTNEEIELHRGDGSRIFMNVNSAPILDNQEQILAAVVVFQDVTARRHTQEALRQSEERFRQMAETIQDAFWITDFRVPRILYVSPAYEQIWGRSPDTLYHDYSIWVETIHPEDREKAIAIAATCQYENVVENEYRIVRPDGSIRWIRDRGFALRDEVGEIDHVVGVAQDVTQLKQTEIALRQSEERFQLIAQATNDVMWDYNVLTNQMWWSDRVHRLFGYQPEELGTTMQGWAERVHPDDLERIHHSYETCLSGQESLWTGEYRFCRADGSYAYVLDRAYIIRDAEGKPVRIVGAMVDISDRKQADENLRLSENRYRTLANAVSLLMWVNDTNGNIEFFNQRWQEYTGVEVLELGVGLWPNIIHPDDFQPTLAKRTQAIQAGVAYEVECRLKRFDQTYRWHLARIVPFKDQEGNVLQWFGTATDIHDVKQTEAALRESEVIAKARAKELETFMETVPAAVWIAHDPQCHHMSANRAAYELVKLPSGSVATATPVDGEYPFSFKIQKNGQDIPLAELPMQRAGQTGADVEEEFDFVFDNGEIRSIWGRAVPLRDDGGEIRGVIGAFLDISDRKRTEAELREREQRFSTLFNGMEDWVLVYNLTPDNQPGHFIEVNEQACKKLGFSREEFLTMSVSDIIGSPLVSPKASVEKLLKDKYVVVESVHTTKDGRRIPCEVSATLFTLNGLPTIQSICRDITERKQAEKALRDSEERYRQIVETADEGIWIIDAQARTTFVNRTMAEMFGYTESEMMGRTIYDFMDEQAIAVAEQNFERRRQGIREQHDFCFLRKDGSSIWTMLSTNALFNDQGVFVGALAMVTDVTERKQAEQEREQLLARERVAREEAEAANRIKDEFLAVLSHELRSPLNPILGWSKLLRSRRFDEQATARALETIERNAKLQAQLIEDLLDVSRILRGKLALNIAPVNLVTTIEGALETMRLAAQAKGIQIQTILAPNVGQVRGDSGRLQQVVWNLLSNAIKFTPTGGQVEVYLERVGNFAQIQVKDNGKGITPEFLPYVFEYFRQADGATTRQFGGLGLGLAIVRHLTELHGGTVQADSPGEGLGATFTVKLPLIEEVRESRQNEEQHAAADLNGVRVLVVDDEADMRELVAFILEESGAQVQVTASAAEALERFETFQPHILISDIGMPKVDGYMLMRQVRERSPEQGGQIPAIALTAYAGEANEQQAISAGFQRHLSKPIEPNELVKAITNLVSSDR